MAKQRNAPITDTAEPAVVPPPPPELAAHLAAEQVVADKPEAQPAPNVAAQAPSAPASNEAEKTEVQDKQRPLPPNPVNPLANESGLLCGENFNEQWKIASMMANSEMLPDHFRGKPAAVLMAMQTARSRGLNPLTAIQQMANLFGRTINWGELPLGEAFESKKLKYFEEFWIDKDGKRIADMDIKTAVFGCVTIAEGLDSPQGRVTRIFTLDDAKVAGLTEDPKRKTWRQYAKRMLQMRSRGWALKDAVPQVTAGIQMPEYDDHAPELSPPSAKGNLAGAMAQMLEAPVENPVQA